MTEQIVTGTIGALTYAQLISFVAVGYIIVQIFNAVMTAIKNWRDEKRRKDRPVDTLETKVEEHEKRLRKDYDRINDLEEGNRVMMRAMMAILSHEISGNSIDKLKASMDEIQRYLIDK